MKSGKVFSVKVVKNGKFAYVIEKCKSSDTIQQLLGKIEDKTHVPTSKRLMRRFIKDTWLQDNDLERHKTLGELGFKEGSTVKLENSQFEF